SIGRSRTLRAGSADFSEGIVASVRRASRRTRGFSSATSRASGTSLGSPATSAGNASSFANKQTHVARRRWILEEIMSQTFLIKVRQCSGCCYTQSAILGGNQIVHQ